MKKRLSAVVLLLALLFMTGQVLAQNTVSYTADVQKVVLDNGLTLLLKENPAYDIIALALLSNVGTVQDPEGLEGLTYLTQTNLLSGTPTRSSQELVVELESLGVRLQTAATYDYSAVLLQTLPTTFDQAFAVFLDMLENATYPEAEFERERYLGQVILQSLADDPSNALIMAYLEVFYGDHPYKFTPYGSDLGLASVQREHLRKWHDFIYQPEHLVVAVVGNFDSAELLPVLEESFGSWQSSYSGYPVPRAEVAFEYPSEAREMVINLPTEAAFLILGYPAPDSFHVDSAALEIINTVLGGGMSSRLFTEIRDKRGLAYTAMSQYDSRLGPSSFFTFLASHPSTVEQAKEQVLMEVERFITEGLSAEEIAQVAAQKRGSYLLQNETNIAQGLMLAMAELSGLGYQWVDEYMTFFDDVTPEDIQRVAAKYFEHYTSILITP